MADRREAADGEIIIEDKRHGRRYLKGRFLGKVSLHKFTYGFAVVDSPLSRVAFFHFATGWVRSVP